MERNPSPTSPGDAEPSSSEFEKPSPRPTAPPTLANQQSPNSVADIPSHRSTSPQRLAGPAEIPVPMESPLGP
eukprot:8685684-Karenia_brevis.AAC.1